MVKVDTSATVLIVGDSSNFVLFSPLATAFDVLVISVATGYAPIRRIKHRRAIIRATR